VKYWKPLLLLLILIGGGMAAKIFFFPAPKKGVQAGAGPAGPQVANVDGFVTAYTALDNQIFATGSLMANELVEIKPEVPGRLTYLYLPEGQIVQKGQLLARVNDADLRAQLKRLEVQIKIAESKEERAKKLVDISGLSIEEYEDALNSLNVLRADIDYTKALISKTEIRAPFTGKLGFRNVSDGSFVSTSDVMSTLQQLNPIKLEFSIPERYSAEAKEGNIIRFTVDGIDEIFEAKVYAIEPAIDQNSRSLLLRAKADNSRLLLKPGGFARITLSTGIDNRCHHDTFTQAIIPILKGQQVMKVVDGAVQPQPVVLGFRDAGKVQVLEGLSEGDTIVTTGILSLRPGSLVNIKALTK
jgi:membrane fusion protein, multidrug efflux system